MTLTVRIITPDRIVWDDTVDEVILPSTTGQLGILTDHAPLLTALDMGVMRVRPGKDWKSIAVLGGFAEVENNEVKVLVNGAELGETINLDAARKDYNQAQKDLESAMTAGNRQKEFQAKQDLKRARARVQAAGGSI